MAKIYPNMGKEFCENPLHEIKHSCNVRGCEKDNGLHIHLKCKNNPNCYYKQLQRLKEEFSSYEDDIEDWVSDNSILYQYDDRTPNTLEELQACMESSHEQWQQYKQALQEIREIADIIANANCNYVIEADNIIEKINEVIGVEE